MDMLKKALKRKASSDALLDGDIAARQRKRAAYDVDATDMTPRPARVFNDSIHGHIEMDDLCVRIMDTPQFQRLRHLKQLGGTYFVFPGASHNRFEHSIGVCHLAGELVETLRRADDTLGITDEDVLCVKIAGLCHDLGHGPFSHLFDGVFIPSVCPAEKWNHEQASVAMFDHLISENGLKAAFLARHLTDADIQFVKEQIAGPPDEFEQEDLSADNWPYQGRGKEKSFLYEIVANKRNGIDVDKWDYFARDCYNLGISNSFDHKRFMKFVKVLHCEEDGLKQICPREKEVSSLYDMFHVRNSLHRRAYQHKTANVVEHMVNEVLMIANDHIKLPGSDGKMLRMSEAIHDMAAYTHLTDDVLSLINMSTAPALAPARRIMQDIHSRRLYKYVGQTQSHFAKVSKLEDIKRMKEIAQDMVHCIEKLQIKTDVVPEDVVVQIVHLDYGMGDQDPIQLVRFYTKENPDKTCQIRRGQVSRMLPERFEEQHIRVYSKRRDAEAVNVLRLGFADWCHRHGFEAPKGASVAPELTPTKAAGSRLKRRDTGNHTPHKLDLSD